MRPQQITGMMALCADAKRYQLAARFGYPCLSCRITVAGNRTIRLLPDKWV
jgi:hypothetical protein